MLAILGAIACGRQLPQAVASQKRFQEKSRHFSASKARPDNDLGQVIVSGET